MINYELKSEDGFKYIETKGGSKTLMLLHGLLGELSNFDGILNYFHNKYNVVIPILPILDMPFLKLSVSGLVDHVHQFVMHKKYDKVNILGNSLGGHICLLYTLEHPEKVDTLTITGSSGLFESAMGTTFPKRGDYEYIKKKSEDTFYDPKVATKELVDNIFETVNDRTKAIRIVATSKSAVRNNIADKLDKIKAPTLLIWGKQDIVTPPFVGEKFNELIEDSELHWIDKCGHAPMMEHPDQFNKILEDFLNRRATG